MAMILELQWNRFNRGR